MIEILLAWVLENCRIRARFWVSIRVQESPIAFNVTAFVSLVQALEPAHVDISLTDLAQHTFQISV